MYRPKHFQLDELKIPEFLEQHPFATLISIEKGEAVINNAPLYYDKNKHCLVGHFAKGNHHLKCMENNPQLSIIFQGADGYISPAWYKDATQVPTWNYSSVEVKGNATLINDPKRKQYILEQLIAQHEKRVHENWQISKVPSEKLTALLSAITAFEIQITGWQGKAKLSQNKSLTERLRVIEKLRNLNDCKNGELARVMSESIGRKSE